MIPEVTGNASDSDQQNNSVSNNLKPLIQLKTIVLPRYEEVISGPVGNGLSIQATGLEDDREVLGAWAEYDIPRDDLGRERRSIIGLAL